MNHERSFMICSCVILVLAAINLSIGPIINCRVRDWPWSLWNCKKISDELAQKKADNAQIKDIKNLEIKLSDCRHKKTMHILEELSFVANLFIGFTCFLSGFFGLEKELKTKMGIVGMIFGVIGFILTFIYVIYNGIVITNHYNYKSIYKVDGDSAFAELDGNNYKCFYFNEKDDTEALIAKYSDLIKSQYNYNKGLKNAYYDKDSELHNCGYSPDLCLENGYIDGPKTYFDSIGLKTCVKLYRYREFDDNSNFEIGSRFLASLILSLLTCLCLCGLVFCGFLIFKEQ